MKTYKWDKIKDTVASAVGRELADSFSPRGKEAAIAAVLCVIDEPARGDWRTRVEEIASAAEARILAWDVRLAGRLRDLFPEFFPPELRSGALAAEMDDSPGADWVVYRKGA